jgi:hypothetical protein
MRSDAGPCRPAPEAATLANTAALFGFQPYGISEGRAPTFGLRRRTIAQNYTTALFRGDPVCTSVTDGSMVIAPDQTTPLAGIFWGCEYTTASPLTSLPVKSRYWPGVSLANTALVVTAFIIDDPEELFLAATFGTLPGGVTSAAIGNNIRYHTGTGSTATGISGYTLDDGNITTTNTLPFKIVDLYATRAVPNVNGAQAGTLNWAICKMNNTERAAGTTGV